MAVAERRELRRTYPNEIAGSKFYENLDNVVSWRRRKRKNDDANGSPLVPGTRFSCATDSGKLALIWNGLT
jgi:hypothetical protein